MTVATGPSPATLARAGIAIYWIINLTQRQIEVHTSPSGPIVEPAYARRDDYRLSDPIPIVIDGRQVGAVKAADLFP